VKSFHKRWATRRSFSCRQLARPLLSLTLSSTSGLLHPPPSCNTTRVTGTTVASSHDAFAWNQITAFCMHRVMLIVPFFIYNQRLTWIGECCTRHIQDRSVGDVPEGRTKAPPSHISCHERQWEWVHRRRRTNVFRRRWSVRVPHPSMHCCCLFHKDYFFHRRISFVHMAHVIIGSVLTAFLCENYNEVVHCMLQRALHSALTLKHRYPSLPNTLGASSHGIHRYYHVQMLNGDGGQLTEFVPPSRIFQEISSFCRQARSTSIFVLNLSDLKPAVLTVRPYDPPSCCRRHGDGAIHSLEPSDSQRPCLVLCEFRQTRK
jgi:hypothetical protein